MLKTIQLISAFLRLIRWQNLLFIALAQCMFYFFILIPSFQTHLGQFQYKLQLDLFFCICLSSVLITAGGYVINDYFDLAVDRINKPEKLIVDRLIRRRWAIVWHLALSITGVLLGVYVGYKTGNHLIGLANLFCMAILWFYSTLLKKKLFIGNILIALLSAWVILVVWFCEIRIGRVEPGFTDVQTRIYRLGVLYAAFAFTISLIRDLIKDIEDMFIDEKYGHRTIPLVWGINAAKLFILNWLVVLTLAIVIVQIYALQLQWWWSVAFSVLLIIIPLLTLFKPILNAKDTRDYRLIMNKIKLIMLAGIISMIFFKLY